MTEAILSLTQWFKMSKNVCIILREIPTERTIVVGGGLYYKDTKNGIHIQVLVFILKKNMTPEELREAVMVIVNKILTGDTSVNVGDIVILVNENI